MPGVKDWLGKASRDLKASKILSDYDEVLDCSVFHTHQCAEKAFKAFIVFTGQAIPKTHDLRFLLEHCAELDSELMLLKEDCKNLNSYGSDSRYPNDRFYVDKQRTKDAVGMAETILTAIKEKLEGK